MTHPAEQKLPNLSLDGILDLHQFHPAEVDDLVREYLRACRQAGVLQLRIIHGKGKGVLRRRVQQILAEEPAVRSYGLAQDRSSWGATWVDLYPADVTPPRKATRLPVAPIRPPFWYRLLQAIFLRR